MTAKLKAIAQADTPSGVAVPSSPTGFAMYLVSKLGANIVFAIVLGLAAHQMYQDNAETNAARYNDIKVHQVELMAYLTNRNDADSKRAVADADLSRSLQRLSDALDQLRFEARTAHTTKQP